MTSKQQSSHPSQNVSSVSAESMPRSLIFLYIPFNRNAEYLLQDLRRNYSGIENVVLLQLLDNNGRTINALQIDVESDNFANQFLDKNHITINENEYVIRLLTQSLIVSKVSSRENEIRILQDLEANYSNIKEISRFYNSQGKPIDSIQIHFKSKTSAKQILSDDYILINGKRRPVQYCWSLIHIRKNTKNSDNHISDQSRSSVPVKSTKDLFYEQQMELDAVVQEFTHKRNTCLSSLTQTTSTNTNTDQLTPIMRDLMMVTQQFIQTNIQLQKQLDFIIDRTGIM